MSVSDGQPVNQTVTNAAFMSRTTDTNTTGKVDLENTDLASGASVLNAQKSLNGQASFTGANANGAENQKPLWSNNDFGTSTDDVKTRADVLTGALGAVSNQLSVQIPQWTKVTIAYTDIQIAATSNTLVSFTLPAAGVIHAIVVKHTTEFVGGSVSDVTLDLGISGESARYIDDHSIFSTPVGTDFEALSLVEIFDFGATQDIEALFNSVGDNLDQLTQGSLDVYFLTTKLGF